MRLNELPAWQHAEITTIDWAAMPEHEAKRLRELGFDHGVSVEIHRRGGITGKGPIAMRVGRMIVAIQPLHAAAITVGATDLP